LAWAAREVARHPVRYFVSVAARVVYAASFHPWYFVAALTALWIFRRDRRFRMMGLFIAYFLGIHCTMSLDSSYLIPLWPLVLAAAGAGLGRALPRSRQ